jgi:hypothetical protein
MRSICFAILMLSVALTSAWAKPASILEPASPWVLNYADNDCRLIRMFGPGKGSIKLVFEQVAPRSPMTVMLIGKFHAPLDSNVLAFEPLPEVRIGGGQSLDAVQSDDSVVFWPRRFGRGRWGLISDSLADRMRKEDPGGAEISRSAPSNPHANRIAWKDHDWTVQSAEQWQAEDAGFGARAGQVRSVVLNPTRSGSVFLHTGALAAPLKALEQCAFDSLKAWGIDPAVQSTVATSAHPVMDAQKLFTSDDYPYAAWQAAKEDNLDVWLNIDAQGGIASCRVISDFATPEINGAICAMVRRKERFVPARTKDGTPVPDYYIQSFVFRMG